MFYFAVFPVFKAFVSRPLEIRNKVTGFLRNQLKGKKLHKAVFFCR